MRAGRARPPMPSVPSDGLPVDVVVLRRGHVDPRRPRRRDGADRQRRRHRGRGDGHGDARRRHRARLAHASASTHARRSASGVADVLATPSPAVVVEVVGGQAVGRARARGQRRPRHRALRAGRRLRLVLRRRHHPEGARSSTSCSSTRSATTPSSTSAFVTDDGVQEPDSPAGDLGAAALARHDPGERPRAPAALGRGPRPRPDRTRRRRTHAALRRHRVRRRGRAPGHRGVDSARCRRAASGTSRTAPPATARPVRSRSRTSARRRPPSK